MLGSITPIPSILNETYADVWLEAGQLVPISLRYAQKLGETKSRLLWENDSMEKTVIAKEYLYHVLGSQTTPFDFSVIPAQTNASFSHLTNDFDYRFAVVDVEEVLIINNRDEFTNL